MNSALDPGSIKTSVAEQQPDLYLDACATTPLRPGVVEAMLEVHANAWGNPSSLHGFGLAAAESLERSRSRIALALNASQDDVVLTSGATESIHLALHGFAAHQSPGRVVISAVEHPAVTAAAERLKGWGWQVMLWPVDAFGRIDLSFLEEMLSPPTRLVSLIWGQSEVGTLQPIHAVGVACSNRGIPFHVDATQVVSQGRPDWSALPADFLSASAHKFGGPKGIGLLLIRHGRRQDMHPLLGGGGQEQGLRAGTIPVSLAAGLAEALDRSPSWTPGDRTPDVPNDLNGIVGLRDQLLEMLLVDSRYQLTGDPENRLPHHISLLVFNHQKRPVSGRALVRALAQRGIAVSSGSACSSGQDSGSPILAAMGVDPALVRSGLRLSLGPWLAADQLPQLVAVMDQTLTDLDDATA